MISACLRYGYYLLLLVSTIAVTVKSRTYYRNVLDHCLSLLVLLCFLHHYAADHCQDHQQHHPSKYYRLFYRSQHFHLLHALVLNQTFCLILKYYDHLYLQYSLHPFHVQDISLQVEALEFER
jgi:hypothetical protein